MLGYPIMPNKSSKWSASNRLLLSLLLSPHRKPTEREHYQVYQAVGGQIAQVRVFCALSLFLVQTWRLSIPQTELQPPRNFLSPLLSSNQSTVSPKHLHTHHITHSHLFPYAAVSQSSFLTFHCLSPAQLVFLFTPSHIFYIPFYFVNIHISLVSTTSSSVETVLDNTISFSVCSYLYLRAPKSLRTGLLCCGWSPSPPDSYTTGLWCAEWLNFRAEAVGPSQLLTPYMCLCFFMEIGAA